MIDTWYWGVGRTQSIQPGRALSFGVIEINLEITGISSLTLKQPTERASQWTKDKNLRMGHFSFYMYVKC